ncbi:MAG TPA: diphthine--ammonia ligase [Candidatus Acidoferrales bacterium]
MKEKMLLSWSGGKDSSMTLYEIQQTQNYEIAALLTTVTDGYDRISMHGVRQTLLERQAESLGLTLHKIYLSMNATNKEYESKMETALELYQKNGVASVAFGDIFLEDLRQYREQNLSKIGMKGLFPIWKRNTSDLVRTFVNVGFKAIVVCVDSKVLDQSFAGKLIDDDFLHQLPPGIDPCGENGEFHSFVFGGPIFKGEVSFTLGDVVLRDSFYFCDLVPVE